MFDIISIGDTSHNVFLEMSPDDVHLHQIRHEALQMCFNYADKIPVKALHDTIGGNSANTAVGFARLGFNTAMYTHVGNDDQGQRIVKEFKKNNVAPDYVVTDSDKGTNFSTVINLSAERTILVYHEHRHFRLPKLEPAKWVYLSSMGEGCEVIYDDLIDYVREHDAKLCYQPGTFQLRFGAARTAKLLHASHVFCVNKEEAELYLDREPTKDIRSLLDGLRALGPKIVLITDGPKGAYATDGKEYLYLGIIEEAPRLEATGAGDAFETGFMSGLASGLSLGEAMRWGQGESSSVIQQVGPQAGLLFKKQLEQLLADHPGLQAVDMAE